MAVLIKALIDSLLTPGDNWRFYLLQNWSTIIGDLHMHLCLEKILGDTLIVGVYNSHWMQEIFLLSPTIIRTINTKLGAHYIARLQLKLKERKAMAIKKNKPSPRPVSLALHLRPEQALALTKVKDQELRDYLYAFLIRCKREQAA